MKHVETLRHLEAKADPQIATILSRRNPGVRAIGVRFGDVDRLAKEIGVDHDLAMQLWDAGVLEARFLAMKIVDPSRFTRADLTEMVREIDYPTLADLFAHQVFQTPWAVSLMRTWTSRKAEFVRRTGYTLLYDLAADPSGRVDEEELAAYLDRIGAEIHASANWAREAMNLVPIAIGKAHPTLADRALRVTAAYGKVQVFHGDQTNCKIWDAAEALRDPRVKVKVPTLSKTSALRTPASSHPR